MINPEQGYIKDQENPPTNTEYSMRFSFSAGSSNNGPYNSFRKAEN